MRSQAASCWQAARMTQAPTGRIIPVSSSTLTKRSGRHQAVTRAMPAHEGLDAGDLAAAQVGLGLEVQS